MLEKPLIENKTRMDNRETSNTSENCEGVFSIDPSDEEYKDILKNLRRKLETTKAAEMPCKRAFPQARTREFKNRRMPNKNMLNFCERISSPNLFFSKQNFFRSMLFGTVLHTRVLRAGVRVSFVQAELRDPQGEPRLHVCQRSWCVHTCVNVWRSFIGSIFWVHFGSILIIV